VKVWVYSIFFNEAPMMAYFMRHYSAFADKIILFDDHSTDSGPEIARRMGAEVRPYPGAGFDDVAHAEFSSDAYREARGQADWVIWADADELVYHPLILMTLGRYMASGVTLPLIDGWQMFCDHFPTTGEQITDEIKYGAPWAPQGKPCVLNPAIDVRWGAGRHGTYHAEGAVRSQAAEIKNLHYRHLGEAHYNGRNAKNFERMTPGNIAAGLGNQVYPWNHDKHGWHTQQGWQLTQVVA